MLTPGDPIQFTRDYYNAALFWYPVVLLGLFVVMIVGMIVSFYSDSDNTWVEPDPEKPPKPDDPPLTELHI